MILRIGVTFFLLAISSLGFAQQEAFEGDPLFEKALAATKNMQTLAEKQRCDALPDDYGYGLLGKAVPNTKSINTVPGWRIQIGVFENTVPWNLKNAKGYVIQLLPGATAYTVLSEKAYTDEDLADGEVQRMQALGFKGKQNGAFKIPVLVFVQ